MTEEIDRVDPKNRDRPPLPEDAKAAVKRLLDGNHSFVTSYEGQQMVPLAPGEIGIRRGGGVPEQRPFAAILGCADARIHTEEIFRCPSNALFGVRVAGNVAGAECLGSLEYAVANLPDSLRVIVVLGHSLCGAVTAAVDSYLDPETYPSLSAPLKSIIDRILPAVRMAGDALAATLEGRTVDRPGERHALIESSVRLNAALTAAEIKKALSFPVLYGVYDLASREVDLTEPPEDSRAMLTLAVEVASSFKGDPTDRLSVSD